MWGVDKGRVGRVTKREGEVPPLRAMPATAQAGGMREARRLSQHLSRWQPRRTHHLLLLSLLSLLLPPACAAVPTQQDAEAGAVAESGASPTGPPLPLAAQLPKGGRGRVAAPDGAAAPLAGGAALDAKKRMLKELIRKLGEPCAQQCVGEEGVNGKECHGACEQRKMAKMKRFLATVTKRAKTQRTRRQVKEVGTTSPQKKSWLIAKTLSMMPRAEARADDAVRKKEAAAFFAAKFAKNKPSSRFPKVSI